MVFKYKGIAKTGASIKGTIIADSYSEAITQLKDKKILVSSIAEANYNDAGLFKKSEPDFSDFEYITSELSLLLNSGVRIDKALKILERAKAGTITGKIIKHLSDEINKGKPLSDAFADYPQYFDPLYINLLKIAEETANLPKVFSGLGKDMKFKVDLARKIKSALAYPLVILSVCIISILFIFNFVVPNLAGMFADAESLPLYTEIILGTSDFFINYQLYLALALGGVFLYTYSIRKEAKFTHFKDEFKSKMPILDSFFMKSQRIKFCSSVVLMLNSGINIEKAVAYACNNVKSKLLKKEINYALQTIRKGEGISEALSVSRLFPDYYLSLIEVGEESANLGPVFSEICERSKIEFEVSVDKALNLFEPLLILVMGGIVGSVVVTMMLSITSLTDIGF